MEALDFMPGDRVTPAKGKSSRTLAPSGGRKEYAEMFFHLARLGHSREVYFLQLCQGSGFLPPTGFGTPDSVAFCTEG